MLDLPASDPGRYSLEIAVMREMHWSWQELYDAPPDLVEEIYHKMTVRTQMQEDRRKKDEAMQKAKAGR